MSLTPAQIDALPDYSNAQMVKLLRHALATLASAPEGAVVMVNGRQYTTHNLAVLRNVLQEFEAMAIRDADAAGADDGAPLVSYQEPQA